MSGDASRLIVDEVASVVARVDRLIVGLRSLHDVRERGRLTKTKRAALTELAEALRGLDRVLASLLEPADDSVREAVRVEFERFQLLRRGQR